MAEYHVPCQNAFLLRSKPRSLRKVNARGSSAVHEVTLEPSSPTSSRCWAGVPCSAATHQPHHQVGEDSDPQCGGDESDHEELLPAGLAAVGDGDAQEEDEWPGEHPLGFVPSCLCRGMGQRQKGEGERERNTHWGYTAASQPVGLFFSSQENATSVTEQLASQNHTRP